MDSASASATAPRLDRILAAIPTHRYPPRTVDQIAETLAAAGVDASAARAAVEAAVAWLELLNVLDRSALGYRASNQAATYFINSLIWYASTGQTALGDWTRRGAQTDPVPDAILEQPVQLLKQLEFRRLRLGRANHLFAPPTREQDVAFVLVQGLREGEVHYLHQFDPDSGHDQLIGGRIEPGETPEQAAYREFAEELGDGQEPPLAPERDYHLEPLLLEPIGITAVSATYGALTAYRFHIFGAHLRMPALQLSPRDRWISVRDMLASDAPSEAIRRLNHALPQGLRGLALTGVAIQP